MSIVIDQSQSKRPIRAETNVDYLQWVNKAGEIEKFIEQLEAVIYAKENNPQFQLVLKDSRDRIISLALRAAEIEPTNALGLAELRGRIAERKDLTTELANLTKQVEEKKRFLSTLREKVQRWMERNKEKGSK